MNLALIFLFVYGCSTSWVKEMEDKYLYEGDIVLDPDEDERNNNGFSSLKGGRWPGGRIPYVIDNSIGSYGRVAIMNAIQQYHSHTCLRFHQRRSEREYLRFYKGNGCSSPIGFRLLRRNDVSLASGCWHTGTVMHEIGHSIGLYHEQSRPDRDNYIDIIWNNIEWKQRHNFMKQLKLFVTSFGTPYDYESMMHYGQTAFGNGKVTIKTKDASKQRLIGNNMGFSEIDKKQINLMYCGGFYPGTPAPCRDKSSSCSVWAKLGRCTWNPSYMNDCLKSCGRC